MERMILYKKKSESKWVVCVILRVEEMFVKSRTLLICTLILIPVFFIAMGVIAALDLGVWGYVIGLAGVAGIALLFYLIMRCPHCHKAGLLPQIPWKNAGFCRCCGEQIFWKECQDDE